MQAEMQSILRKISSERVRVSRLCRGSIDCDASRSVIGNKRSMNWREGSPSESNRMRENEIDLKAVAFWVLNSWSIATARSFNLHSSFFKVVCRLRGLKTLRLRESKHVTSHESIHMISQAAWECFSCGTIPPMPGLPPFDFFAGPKRASRTSTRHLSPSAGLASAILAVRLHSCIGFNPRDNCDL